MAFGCETTPVVEPPLSGTVADPSAEALHEVCGQLLVYYALNQALPPNLDALRGAEAGDKAPLVSPGSGKPYFYHNPPIILPGRTGGLLIHDPATAKATVRGRPARWVVLVAEPDPETNPGGPLTTQVFLMSEAELGAALSAARERAQKASDSQEP